MSKKRSVEKGNKSEDGSRGAGQWSDRAYAAFRDGDPVQAERFLRIALSLQPDLASAQSRLGELAKSRADMLYYRRGVARAVCIVPTDPFHRNNHANALSETGHLAAALTNYHCAIALKPDLAPAHYNLGRALLQDGKVDEGATAYRHTMILEPYLGQAHVNLANALQEQGRLDQSIAAYRTAMAVDPTNDLALVNPLFLALYLPGISSGAIGEQARLWGRRLFGDPPPTISPGLTSLPRIGLVSADFHRHAVSKLTFPGIAALRQQGWTIIGYDNGNQRDSEWEANRALLSAFREIRGRRDDDVRQMIRADRIDILIDLSGYSGGHRMSLFGARAAPMQIGGWCGYPATTGIPAMDYFLADRHQCPDSALADYSEAVIRLPDHYVSWAPDPADPDPGPPPAFRRGHVTFGSFNVLKKITPQVVALWSRILNALPESRLLFKSVYIANPETRRHYLDMFAAHGVSPARIDIMGGTPADKHRALMADADIALDPFPYSGGMTTLECLWMGLPVVSLPGSSFASRHTLGYLTAAGLAELAAKDEDQYVAIALRLAGDLAALAELRAGMRQRLLRSRLHDAPRFARHLGSALSAIWQRHRAGLPPISFDVAPIEDRPPQHWLIEGDAAVARQDYAGACLAYGCALAEPGWGSGALFGLATARQAAGEIDVAETHYKGVVAFHPDNWLAFSSLGTLKTEAGAAGAALLCFERARRLAPTEPRVHANRLMALHYAPGIEDAEIRAATREAAAILPPPQPLPPRPQAFGRRRIGFVSADLVRHPVGQFLLPVLEELDRERFEPFLYFTGRQQDALSEKMKSLAQWRDSPERETILADGIDILIDLSGHTRGNRLDIFSRRAAPVQMSWLGYYDSTGVAAMDYTLMDRWHVPPGSEHRFNEQVLRLPHSRFCYAPVPNCPEVPPVAASRSGYVTFGSVNNTAKINGQVIALWARVLAAVPESRLLLKWRTLVSPALCDELARLFLAHGVARERIEFRPGSPQLEVLRQYGDIDIALDPFPFTGGYTSCEALWMGVPVLTMPLERPASRHTLSLIGSLGRADWLEEWVAADAEDYVAKAKRLAGDLDHLARIRSELRPAMRASPLMDAAGFTRDLENLFDMAISSAMPDPVREHLQFADAEIARLQKRLDQALVARAAYLARLKTLLPPKER